MPIPDRFARLAELERRYTGPIPKHLLEPLLSKATPTEIALAEERVYLAWLRQSLGYRSLTEKDREQVRRGIARAAARIAELEKEKTDG